MICYNLGEYAEAIKCYDLILELQSIANLFHVYFNKSVCLKKLDNYEQSLNCIIKGLSYDPDNIRGIELKKELLSVRKEKASKGRILNGVLNQNLEHICTPHPDTHSSTPLINKISAPSEVQNKAISVSDEKDVFLNEIRE